MLAAGTGLRVVASPVVMALVLTGSYTAAAIVFVLAAVTDWFDGRLARR
jgi:phosphatidylglycerophosphate synthase